MSSLVIGFEIKVALYIMNTRLITGALLLTRENFYNWMDE